MIGIQGEGREGYKRYMGKKTGRGGCKGDSEGDSKGDSDGEQ